LIRIEGGTVTVNPDKRFRIVAELEAIGREKHVSLDVAALRRAANLRTDETSTAEDPRSRIDHSTSRVNRRVAVQLISGALGPAPWRALFQVGRGFDSQMFLDESADVYGLAMRYAESSNSKSLVAAQDAITRLHQGQYQDARQLWEQAVSLLGVSIPTTAHHVSPRVIESTFQGLDAQDGIEAFALVSQWHGMMSQFNMDFQAAEIAFGNWQRAAEVLDNTSMRADALMSQGIVILEQGADIEPEQFDWRVLRDEELVRRALDKFSQARQFRSSASSVPMWAEFGAADDWRQEASGYLVLSEIDDDLAARRSQQRARETAKDLAVSGLARTRMHLALDEGRWLRADGDAAASDVLEQAKALAIEGRSPATLSLVLGQLAGLECADLEWMKPGPRRRALDLAAAALIVWPFPFLTRDARHDLNLFDSLEGSTAHLQSFLDRDGDLRDEVLKVIGKDIDHRIGAAARHVDGLRSRG